MILSTCGKDLRPSSRVVLMKGLDETGVVFFTHYDSRKGLQLKENPQASLLFFWPQLERQVRLEGSVYKTSEKESDDYFATRPEASRISASVSPQSREIPGREWLVERWREAVGSGQARVGTHTCVSAGVSETHVCVPTGVPETQLCVSAISRPKDWGGYRLVPDYLEFWQGREDRLHDRIAFKRMESGWRIFRLAP
jgi:pyridoxamine 5'-phosphate oxidase